MDFLELIKSFNLKQHVFVRTHVSGHFLITPADNDRIKDVTFFYDFLTISHPFNCYHWQPRSTQGD